MVPSVRKPMHETSASLPADAESCLPRCARPPRLGPGMPSELRRRLRGARQGYVHDSWKSRSFVPMVFCHKWPVRRDRRSEDGGGWKAGRRAQLDAHDAQAHRWRAAGPKPDFASMAHVCWKICWKRRLSALGRPCGDADRCPLTIGHGSITHAGLANEAAGAEWIKGNLGPVGHKFECYLNPAWQGGAVIDSTYLKQASAFGPLPNSRQPHRACRKAVGRRVGRHGGGSERRWAAPNRNARSELEHGAPVVQRSFWYARRPNQLLLFIVDGRQKHRIAAHTCTHTSCHKRVVAQACASAGCSSWRGL